ncbi:hypothetical protein H5410_008729 [Solanum commersonii]|uniref:Uncharacterized protein n=1 Tax=Solanum commersonii TaxID=4109 RepID=A0A9J6AHL1_SOLCO|nr:hypothetical protein H5410_008729 [Solanum commersonii]
MVADEGVKDRTVADSPVSVLEDEFMVLSHMLSSGYLQRGLGCQIRGRSSLDPENGDATHIPENMAKEEEILIRARDKGGRGTAE